MDNLEKWIKRIEDNISTDEHCAKMAEINEDGETESFWICEAVEHRILCGFLIELKQRREREKELQEMAKRIVEEVNNEKSENKMS